MKTITRTIELKILVDDNDNHSFDGHSRELSRAIGYLASWAIMSDRMSSVKIALDTEGDLFANYFDKDGNQKYYIFGLRDDDSADKQYSFHS
jgi:hypothetical protein